MRVYRSSKVRRKKGPELTEQFITLLREEHGHGMAWVPRRIMEHFGFSARACRLARQYSKGRVLFGQKGYRLTEVATNAEIRSTCNALQTQVDAMMTEIYELKDTLSMRCIERKNEQSIKRSA